MQYQVLHHCHIFEAQRFFPQCHASTLALLPEGGMACAWFAGAHEKAADVGIWLSLQRQGVWTDPVCVALHDGIPCWNPVLHNQTDRLLLFYKVGREIPQWQTFVISSADGGHTWATPQELVAGDVGGRGPVKNKCIALADGSLIAPASLETDSLWDCFTDRSTDGGATWQRGEAVPFPHEHALGLGHIQPTLWQDDHGTVHMLTRSTEGALYHSQSADLGAHWSPARRTALPNNNSGIDIARLDDGRLVLVHNPVAGNWAARSPIAFSVSDDNGQTFDDPQILDHVPCERNQEEAEFSYPSILSHGKDVHITYTWKRRTVAYWHLRLVVHQARNAK